MNIELAVERERRAAYNYVREHLDAGDMQEILREYVCEYEDELSCLAEDLRFGPMQDYTHAGSILADAVDAYANKQANWAAERERQRLEEINERT